MGRDSSGMVREAFASCHWGSVDPGIAEAIGVREALSWIKRKEWAKGEIESNCLIVVQAIQSSVEMISYFGSIISDCRVLLRELKHVVLRFVKRSANRVAHNLARASSIVSDRVYAGSVLSLIQSFVLDDISI